ncbi:DUF1289 domain-containing protein [Dechloromonas sp. ZY10]|uniref:DUF1289 domain-containing protein n=1 Tax=Dechloromonas aquae TaxID=2664436 RepID=UPI0035273D6A
MADGQDDYLCVGVCMADPDSGYCLGCGRPPLGEPEIVAEAVARPVDPLPPGGDPDTPP